MNQFIKTSNNFSVRYPNTKSMLCRGFNKIDTMDLLESQVVGVLKQGQNNFDLILTDLAD